VTGSARLRAEKVPLHGPEAFAGLRAAGRLAAATLDMVTPYVLPGVTTADLDRLCEAFIRGHGALPAPLGYRGFPKATCISLNSVVCHGIPGDRRLEMGDTLNIDVTAILAGWYGDTSRMFVVGGCSGAAARLIDTAHAAMLAGIAAVRPGATLGDVGWAIQSIAEARRYSVVREFCGHGIGRAFHQPPTVLHHGTPGRGLVLEPGMVFTVEPMINAGRREVTVLADGWTAVTRDGSLSAQFEHTVGVTDRGCEVFTLSPAGHAKPPYRTD
jgi:methionyl aminopeptidase